MVASKSAKLFGDHSRIELIIEGARKGLGRVAIWLRWIALNLNLVALVSELVLVWFGFQGSRREVVRIMGRGQRIFNASPPLSFPQPPHQWSGQAGWSETPPSFRFVPLCASAVPGMVRNHGGDHAYGLLLPLPWGGDGLWWSWDRKVLR